MKQQTSCPELRRPTLPHSHTGHPACPPGFTLILSVGVVKVNLFFYARSFKLLRNILIDLIGRHLKSYRYFTVLLNVLKTQCLLKMNLHNY